jgi:hypothetical protein
VTQQGRLLDAEGAPVNGSVSLVARLHETAAGGTPVFTQTFGTDVVDGYYSVVLDTHDVSLAPLDSSLFADPELYVSIGIGAQELSGRSRLTSTPYAAEADVARSVPVSSAPGACDDGQIRWNPATESLQVCDSSAWVLTGGTTGLSQGTFANASVTVNSAGQISAVSAGSTGVTTLQTQTTTVTTLSTWKTASCASGYVMTGCACRYVSDATNFWPGWCEALSATSCRGRGYYGATWTYKVQAICARVQ